ncbi:amidohydrolase family protein [Lewinella sp. W8]|uniref:N-acyl-D-amino-acid deacylase family protein n=1 Tax=Lewinella sp. W8 TaxID=2528208 RepID=UPI0010681341|nr:amidohydrolase family protein [Lewinella sp. W8]MTB50097.1 amidohydrolase family protein [Lewinella sp. W8]
MKKYLLLLLCCGCLTCGEDRLDLLIVGGTVIDGEGLEAYRADVGVRDGEITFVGEATAAERRARRVIDAAGYYVTPGFIDPHTHALRDLSDSVKRVNLNYLMQGVTTVVTGSDGNSVDDIAAQLQHWEENGIGTNAAILTGHRNIRKRIMGMEERAPTAAELSQMRTMVRRGMEAGALGFSSGLYYAPASFADTEEVIELAKVAAAYGGLYDAHIRDESSYNIGLMAAVLESIRVAEVADLPANISHIKCLGVDVWGQSQAIIDTIEAARGRGLTITADQYPYLASGTSLSKALLPKWVFAGFEDYTRKFDEPELLPRIKTDMAENLRRRGGAESLLIVFAKVDSLNGMTLRDISDAYQLPPVEAAIAVMQSGGANVASFNMIPEDLQRFMAQEWVMTCSDGTVAHPRKFGTFSKKLREFVVDKEVLTLAQMVRRSTGLTAETFRMPGRGKVKDGYSADLLVFRPEAVRDHATFTDPNALSTGMEYIVLNGQVVVEAGEFTGELAGEVVRRGER